ncbi:hypothetical protein Q8A67_021194 [Cirrhinus molitorella]|uniref:Uncharacterized protein n=1 Tax=Cirrhinus molitorella TaxID=172907 RepID=A0AA88P833_9TELE|nr:hypothetical protein Q8A67_021194 [Cirrhinus molitorella]
MSNFVVLPILSADRHSEMALFIYIIFNLVLEVKSQDEQPDIRVIHDSQLETYCSIWFIFPFIAFYFLVYVLMWCVSACQSITLSCDADMVLLVLLIFTLFLEVQPQTFSDQSWMTESQTSVQKDSSTTQLGHDAQNTLSDWNQNERPEIKVVHDSQLGQFRVFCEIPGSDNGGYTCFLSLGDEKPQFKKIESHVQSGKPQCSFTVLEYELSNNLKSVKNKVVSCSYSPKNAPSKRSYSDKFNLTVFFTVQISSPPTTKRNSAPTFSTSATTIEPKTTLATESSTCYETTITSTTETTHITSQALNVTWNTTVVLSISTPDKHAGHNSKKTWLFMILASTSGGVFLAGLMGICLCFRQQPRKKSPINTSVAAVSPTPDYIAVNEEHLEENEKVYHVYCTIPDVSTDTHELYSLLLMEVQSYKYPFVKVSPDVTRESSSVKISCETGADVIVQCDFYINSEEKNKKVSPSCELELTGAEVLRWAAVKSPVSLNIYCYYMIGGSTLISSSDSDPATVTVLDSLEKPFITGSKDDELLMIACEIPLSVRADFICSLYTEDDDLVYQRVSRRSQSGGHSVPFLTLTVMEWLIFIAFQLLMEVHSYIFQLFIEVQSHESPTVKVSSDVIRESSSVKISCETPADLSVNQCYFYPNSEEKKIKPSRRCKLKLTGAEVLTWAAVKSPASLNIYCYYTIKDVDKPSAHSPPATVKVLVSTSTTNTQTTTAIKTKSPTVKVSSNFIRESSTVKISCETPEDVTVNQCYFYPNREEKKIKTSWRCELKLTGAEVLTWAAVKSSALLNIYCYYTIKDVDKPSPHSSPATVKVLVSTATSTQRTSQKDIVISMSESPVSHRPVSTSTTNEQTTSTVIKTTLAEMSTSESTTYNKTYLHPTANLSTSMTNETMVSPTTSTLLGNSSMSEHKTPNQKASEIDTFSISATMCPRTAISSLHTSTAHPTDPLTSKYTDIWLYIGLVSTGVTVIMSGFICLYWFASKKRRKHKKFRSIKPDVTSQVIGMSCSGPAEIYSLITAVPATSQPICGGPEHPESHQDSTADPTDTNFIMSVNSIYQPSDVLVNKQQKEGNTEENENAYHLYCTIPDKPVRSNNEDPVYSLVQ